MHAQPGEQFGQVAGPAVVTDLGHRGGERFPHRLVTGIALPQDADALVLFGQVGQVKVDGEGASDLLGRLQAPRRDQRRDLLTVRRVLVPLASARLDHGVSQPLHVGQQLRPGGIADDLAEDVAEQPDIAPHRLRQRGAVSLSFPVHGQSLIPPG